MGNSYAEQEALSPELNMTVYADPKEPVAVLIACQSVRSRLTLQLNNIRSLTLRVIRASMNETLKPIRAAKISSGRCVFRSSTVGIMRSKTFRPEHSSSGTLFINNFFIFTCIHCNDHAFHKESPSILRIQRTQASACSLLFISACRRL